MKHLGLIALAVLAIIPAARAEQPLPIYPGVIHTRIGNDLVIGGRYHRLAYFRTEDSLKKVAEHFKKLWEEEGYPTFLDGDFEEEGVVSCFMTREGVQRAVVLRNHYGKTLGFSVLKDMWMDASPQGAVQQAMPPVEGALFVDDILHKDRDGNAWQRTQIVQGELDGVRKELVKRMELSGYQFVRESSARVGKDPQRLIEHARRGEQVVTVLSQVEPKVVSIHQTWIRTDRVDGIPNDVALEKLRQERKLEKERRK